MHLEVVTVVTVAAVCCQQFRYSPLSVVSSDGEMVKKASSRL